MSEENVRNEIQAKLMSITSSSVCGTVNVIDTPLYARGTSVFNDEQGKE